MLRPSVQAAITLKEYTKAFGDTDLMGLVDELAAQGRLAKDGDFSRAEAMLAVQAHTLDAIFNNLARRAIRSKYLAQMETFLRLAFKAQSQCRATIETLGALKNPRPVSFVGQQNLAVNQQVNNHADPAQTPPRARETDSEPDRLLEVKDAERLDTGAAGMPGSADQELVPVGTLHRTEDAGR